MTANCAYAQVKQIVNTSISDSDIAALIALSDAEIADSGLGWTFGVCPAGNQYVVDS